MAEKKKFSFDPEHGLAEDLKKFSPKIRQKVEEIVLAYATPSFEVEHLTAESLKHASTDPLTGLPNRRCFDNDIRHEIGRIERSSADFSVLFVDLDYFKRVNDRFGHLAGDAVLQAVAKRLQENVRTMDVVARWGGEEFVILLPDADIVAAEQVAEKLRKVISSHPIHNEGRAIEITASFGVAEYRKSTKKGAKEGAENEKGETVKDFMDRADACAYMAKKAGRNKVCVTSMPEKPQKHRLRSFVWKIRAALRQRV